MLKILITLPNSIAGTLIMKGFKQGFRSNGCFVVEKDLREIGIDFIKKIKPDIIFGYDYGFLFSDDDELKDYILQNRDKFLLVHYFADEPAGKYACVNKPHLYKIFKRLNAISYMWDRDFEDDIDGCKFLPLAVNAKAYKILSDETNNKKCYGISFVGRPLTERRQLVLAALIKQFGTLVNIFSYEKHFLQSVEDMKTNGYLTDEELSIYKNSYKGFLNTETELAHVYYNSLININITLQGKSALNYRVFEVLASKGFLITDDLGDIGRMFEISKELEVYNSIDDLVDKVSFYLKHPEFTERIATMGYSNVIKSHTYTARARKIIDDLKKVQNLALKQV